MVRVGAFELHLLVGGGLITAANVLLQVKPPAR
jgi:hypothetical protein